MKLFVLAACLLLLLLSISQQPVEANPLQQGFQGGNRGYFQGLQGSQAYPNNNQQGNQQGNLQTNQEYQTNQGYQRYRCPSKGFHVDPEDCSRFYHCVEENRRLSPYNLYCPSSEYSLASTLDFCTLTNAGRKQPANPPISLYPLKPPVQEFDDRAKQCDWPRNIRRQGSCRRRGNNSSGIQRPDEGQYERLNKLGSNNNNFAATQSGPNNDDYGRNL